MAYPPPNDNPSDEAKQRGIESADVIFAETGLEAELDDPRCGMPATRWLCGSPVTMTRSSRL